MKRNKELIKLLLTQVRDEEEPEGLSKYSEAEQGFHAAILVDEGFVRGETLSGSDGQYRGAAMLNLTSQGYDHLEQLEALPQRRQSESDTDGMTLEVFISHAQDDSEVAESLVDLLRACFPFSAKEIRCTSVDGFGLSAGANFDEQLRQETVSSRAFIGLITPKSIQSAYVLFELGARWGARLPILPLFAKGADASFLKGPLQALHTLDARVPRQMHSFLNDLGKQLSRPLEPVAAYEKHLSRFVEAASSVAKSATPNDLERDIQKLVSPVPRTIRDDIMKMLARRSFIKSAEFVRMSGLSKARVEYYFGELVKAELIVGREDEFDALDTALNYEPTHKGRKYIVEADLDRS
jgi:hypothetical protein